MKLLDRANIANSSVNTVDDFLNHPVLAERDRWRDLDIPGATVQALLPPVQLGTIPARMDAVPAAGQHTEAILTALGYDADDIAGLRADGTTDKERTQP